MTKKPLDFDINPLLGGPSYKEREKSGSPYRVIQISDIDADPDQPRKIFDPESLAELASSIKEHGVLSPIRVKIVGPGTYRIIAGERRYRASKLLGLKSIPVIIDTNDAEDETVLAKQLVENLQRDNLKPLERAVAINELRLRFSLSIRDIAQKLGVSKGVVQRSIEIVELPADLKLALEKGASESKILLIAKLEQLLEREYYLKEIDNFTREELEDAIINKNPITKKNENKLYHGGTAPVAKKRRGVVTSKDLRFVEELQQKIGTKVNLKRNKGRENRGKLIIDFYSDEDLDFVYKKLVS